MLAGLAGAAMVSPAKANTHGFEVIHTFTGPDGLFPVGSLVQTADGRLHGNTSAGGKRDWGAVFRATMHGTLKVTTSFSKRGELGAYPWAPLCCGPDGRLYGTNCYFGSQDAGTLYVIDATASPPCCTSSPTPKVYAVTAGSVIRLGRDGSMDTLHVFAADGHEGSRLSSPLCQAADGSLVGVRCCERATDGCTAPPPSAAESSASRPPDPGLRRRCLAQGAWRRPVPRR
jgi:hypothetical protein